MTAFLAFTWQWKLRQLLWLYWAECREQFQYTIPVHPSIHPPNTHTLLVSEALAQREEKGWTHRDRCTFAQTRKTSENYTLGLVWQFKANTLNSDIYMGRHARQRMIDKSPAPCTFCNKKHWLRLTQGAGTQPRSQGSGVRGQKHGETRVCQPFAPQKPIRKFGLKLWPAIRWHVLNWH